MNVYLLFGFEEVYYNHELAKKLNQHPAVDSIGGIVNRKKHLEFLRNQDDIDYEVLHCITQVHEQLLTQDWSEKQLSEMERRYGRPSLWPYLIADRRYIEYSHDKQRQLLFGWIEFYSDLFTEFEPDLFLAYAIAASHTWIPFTLTKERGGTAVSWKTTRISNKYALMKNTVMDRFWSVDHLFDQFRDGTKSIEDYPQAQKQAKEYLNTFRSQQDVRPGYYSKNEKQLNLKSIQNTISLPLKAIEYWKNYHFEDSEIGENQLYSSPTWKKAVDRVLPHLRRQIIPHLNIFDKPADTEQYVFYPLHLQPEATTSVLAPMYVDQPAIIRQIARSLPINYKLYVKEHPSMAGKRSFSYYNRFSDLSNVKLIHPDADSHELILESEMVTTISGTAGWEGIMYKKPVLTFGNTHYNKMDMVLEGGDPSDFSVNILEGLNKHTHDEKELLQYLTALFEESFEIPGGGFASSEKGAKKRADAIYNEIVTLL